MRETVDRRWCFTIINDSDLCPRNENKKNGACTCTQSQNHKFAAQRNFSGGKWQTNKQSKSNLHKHRPDGLYEDGHIQRTNTQNIKKMK